MKDWDVGGAEEQEGEAAVGGQIEAQSDSDEGDDEGFWSRIMLLALDPFRQLSTCTQATLCLHN